ncbi:calcium/sodium antiporter [Paenirhodobacter hankyongi]|uniref:Sodium:calcium antiporter n=1 Tax=Paenirhodobacter hankyongi TaxID=2294033 RepID=A0A421BPB8_9RHOB|nr:calcium/sodium antiporter [Sinirhodobacter hankyongi]RLL64711.1 sodium:calcium antiporter [Sinirhodobacter hankyongi]
MLIDLVKILAGLGLLVVAGDLLVKGAVNLALRLGIPALIVGLTVVAFGTSAPEMMVSVAAVLDHNPGIALGNVIGSNTANILLVIGIPAIISAIRTDTTDTRESYLLLIATSVLFILVCFMGPIRWPHAALLLGALVLILIRQGRQALAHRAQRENEEIEGVDVHMSLTKVALFIALGLVGLPFGADFLVDGASSIARAAGIPDTVIGLTLVAVGTSLPELATSVTAAVKGRADVALGNVIGSNIFNLLGIIGVAGFFGQLEVPPTMLRLDLWVMLGATLLIAPFILHRWPFTRLVGVGFTLIYAAYVAVLMTAHAG